MSLNYRNRSVNIFNNTETPGFQFETLHDLVHTENFVCLGR